MFETQELTLTCSNCSTKTRKSVGWLKAHDKFVCPGCDTTITLDTEQLVRSLKDAENAAKRLVQDAKRRLSRKR